MSTASKIKTVVLFLPAVGILLTYFLLKTEPLVIVSPTMGFDTTHFQLRLVTDHVQGGHSSITLLDQPAKTLSYRYLLDNTKGEPIARVFIASREKTIDLSSYNKLSITLQSEKQKKVPIILCHPFPLHSTPHEIKSYHLVIHYADPGKALHKQALYLREFATPDWWYSFASNQEYQNVTHDATLVQYLVLSNSAFPGNLNQDTVTVSDLRFEYDFQRFFIWSGIVISLYYLMYVLVVYFPKRLGVETIYLLYKKIETVNYEDSEKQAVIACIEERFKNPELSVSGIQKETGIHERKISAILKKHTQLSFKQYINQLRIEHAKKMLVKTSLTISEIAYECGYNNVTHFNRVFKAEEQCTPQEFRLHKGRVNS